MKNRVKTGIEGLDKLLMGGLRSGRSILLSGPCGSGKSILGMQYIYNGVRKFKEPGLYVSFEESKERIIENMVSVGLNLKSLGKTKKFVLIGGPLGGLSYFMDRINARPDNIIAEIIGVVKENNIKRVVVDSISLFGLLAKNDDERRKAFTKLTHSLSSLGCTTILISESREGSLDLSKFGMEEFIVDGVIALYQIREGERFVSSIVIRKMRGATHDKNLRLFKISNKGIVVYPKENGFSTRLAFNK